MRKYFVTTPLLFLAGVLLAAGNAGADGVALKQLTENGKAILEIENYVFRMKISPEQGGCVVGFYLKSAKLEMVAGHGDKWGMFADMFSQQAWPGELQNNPYEVKILENGPATVSVRLSRMVSGRHGGYFPSLEGIRVEKTYTVKADSPNLYVNYRLVNTTARGKSPAFWLQSFFLAGPDKEKNVYYRPSARGIDVTWYNFKDGKGIRPDDVRDPAAGWLATINKESMTGLIFLMDYDYLRWLYTCQSACTTEWFYDKVIIPGGASWETAVVVVPITGMESVAYASDKLILEAKPDNNAIGFKVRATDKKIDQLDISASVKSVDNEDLAKAAAIKFSNITTTPVSNSMPLSVQINPRECVIPFKLEGSGIDKQGEVVFSGRDITVALLGGLGDERIYRLPVPSKNKRFLKPKKIGRHQAIPPKALLINGVYYRMSKVEEAVDLLGWEKNIGKAAKSQWGGLSLSFWPEDYDRMMAYDIVILSDIDAGTIGAEGLEMLREYVSNGGALLVLGGPFAFAAEGSGLDQMLPVQRAVKGNLTPVTNGKLRAAGDKSNILEGFSISNNPACFWSHDLKPKNETKVELYAGDRPLIITGSYGKGKVAVFLGSTLGTGKTGEIPFWEWPDWPACLSRIIREITT